MKKITAVLLSAAFVLCGALAQKVQAEPYGAPRSFLSAGELSFGLGGGLDFDKWETGGNPMLRQQRVYGKVGFGLGREWAVGLIGGVEDLDSDTDAVDFKSNPVPFIGATLGGPLYHGETLAIGPVVQASYVLQPFKSGGDEIKDMTKVSGALLAQVDVDSASLYFGPSLSFAEATVSGGSDIELANHFGGVFGVRWHLPENWPTNESKPFLSLEFSSNEFQFNRTDVTLELNTTF